MQTSIRQQIKVSLFLLSLVPLLVFGLFATWRVYLDQYQQALDLQKEVTKRVTNEIFILLHEHENKFILLTKLYNLLDLSRPQQYDLLSRTRSFKDKIHHDIIDDIFLVDNSGQLLASASRIHLKSEPDMSGIGELSDLVSRARSQRIFYSSVQTRKETGEPIIFLTVPIKDLQTGMTRGALIARLRLSLVWDQIVHLHFGRKGVIFITDCNGKIVAHPNPSIVLSGRSIDIPEQGKNEITVNGEKVLRVYEQIELSNQSFYIVTDRLAREALSLARSTFIAAVVFLFMTLLGVVLFSVAAARKIIHPLESLTQTAQKICDGKIGAQAEIPKEKEPALLANAFNKMTSQLLEDIEKRKEAEEDLKEYQSTLEDAINERTNKLTEANKNLHMQIMERSKAENALKELLAFSRNLTSTTDLRSLYRKCTELSKELLRLEFSTLMVLSDDRRHLVLEDTIGLPESTIGTLSLVQGQGLSTYVVQEKKAASVSDFATEKRFEIPPIVFEYNITSAICVPMMISDEVTGVLIGHTREKRQFSDDDFLLYQSFANQAAVAINNSLHLNRLEESEKKFRTFFDNASDAIIIYDLDGKLIEVNKVTCDKLGYSRDELLAMNPGEIVAERFAPLIGNRIRSIVHSHEKFFETAHVSRDGKEIPIELSCKLIHHNSQPAILGIARDITERKKVEKELLKVRKLESVGILAGGIAHDFNNILTAIIGNINLATFMVDPEDDVHKLLQDAEKASVRAKDLTRQLLTFSKGGEPVKKIASIAEIIKESADFILRGSNVKCRYHIPDDLWPVEIDTGQMSQVIQNFILNSSQAMPQGGIIDITCRNMAGDATHPLPVCRQDTIRIEIKDQGTGIPEKIIENIFDPYFSTKQTGSGLGLAVTNSIVSKHGGHITVKSEQDIGTTFTIFLVAMPQKKLEKKANKQKGDARAQGKVLVMDDDQAVRGIVQRMLTRLGYEVVLAEDGEKAIRFYKEHLESDTPFDISIFDLTIPGGMGGKEAIVKILDMNPLAKVIVASGYSNDPVMANYEKYGFAGVITKPFRLDDIIHILKTTLES
ncbi:MAG: PAS domain S-box protein [Desulfobulbaceae bacterium]|nr:PAS domain S-box protein [Desulfobulbaceae bacterium]